MDNTKIELVSSKDSPTGTAGRKVNGVFEPISPSSSATDMGFNSGFPTISMDTLKSNETPITSIQPEPATTALDSLQGTLESYKSSLAQEQQLKAEQSGTKTENALADLIKFETSTPGEAELTAQAYSQEGGVNELSAALKDYDQQIFAEEVALNRKIQQIEKNVEGRTRTAIADDIDRAERDSLQKRADLYVIREGIQGKYDSAKAVADQAIAIQFERRKSVLSALERNYNHYKDKYTVEEQRAFEIAQADRERKLDNEEEQAKALQNVKLSAMQMAQSNGAPADVIAAIQSATTPEDVLSVGGQWGSTDMLAQEIKRLQAAKLQTEYNMLQAELSGQGSESEILSPEMREKIGKFAPAQTAVAQIGLSGRMHDLYNKIDKYGSLNPTDVDGRREINAARSALMLEIANAFGQGAIQAGDRDQYEAILGNNWQTAGGVKSAIAEGIAQINGQAKTNIDLTKATYPNAANWEPFTQHLENVELSNFLDSALDVEVDNILENPIAKWLSGEDLYGNEVEPTGFFTKK